MSEPLQDLMEKSKSQVREILNILVEAPYFYREDNEDLFFFLRRHRNEFAQFYDKYYDWALIMDSKCARVYKTRWFNQSISEANRDVFNFRRRDECLGFMILLEFFEHQLEENSLTVEDRDNLRFRFGDLLQYVHRRFIELFPGEDSSRYTEEYCRARVLRQIMPQLEKYRFVRRLTPPQDMRPKEVETIYEALPALYHYNASRLSQAVCELIPPKENAEG